MKRRYIRKKNTSYKNKNNNIERKQNLLQYFHILDTFSVLLRKCFKNHVSCRWQEQTPQEGIEKLNIFYYASNSPKISFCLWINDVIYLFIYLLTCHMVRSLFFHGSPKTQGSVKLKIQVVKSHFEFTIHRKITIFHSEYLQRSKIL